MPFIVTGPDGKKYRVDAPSGTDPEEVAKSVKDHVFKGRNNSVMGKADAAVRGVADTVTWGLADKFAAAANAIIPLDKLGGKPVRSVWDGGGFSSAYEHNKGIERAVSANDDRNLTRYLVGGQIAGAFVPVGNKAMAATKLGGKVARPLAKVASPVTKAAIKTLGKGTTKTAAVALKGAGQGGVYGFNKAEGSLSDRLGAAGQGAAFGAGGGVIGRGIGVGASKLARGKTVSGAMQRLHEAGVQFTPGQLGGKLSQMFEDSVLGSMPLMKSIPLGARQRSNESLNISALNRFALEPIGQSLPRGASPGPETMSAVQSMVHGAKDRAASNMTLTLDDDLLGLVAGLTRDAPRRLGGNAPTYLTQQANALDMLTRRTADDLPITGDELTALNSGLRGKASGFKASGDQDKRDIGDYLWELHDGLDDALMRQNPGGALDDFVNARTAQSGLARLEDAASRGENKVFTPAQFGAAAEKRGYGVTTAKVAAAKSAMMQMANDAKATMFQGGANSGTGERVAAMGLLGGGAGGLGMIDPTIGTLAGASLARYIPGIDRALQNFKLSRPKSLRKAGQQIDKWTPEMAEALSRYGIVNSQEDQ
jgi:hypothetical protein